MPTEVILKQIGNGQITIPQAWRKLLGIDKTYVKASIIGSKVVIEPLDNELDDWDIKDINFDDLNKENVQLIKKGSSSYKKGKKSDFTSHNDFWSNV